ncbi:hypothetical protein [Lysobacter enzymogenes]|uniref:hypothetical protein n=1 Tax=Lysobacter enzymogenes TaxID=69 RepID=UPI0009D2AB0E|nr:hypothetical protein [Lysobacter enzymogenes]UZW63173.1 hypothetical protein BV903_013185 [Lysobacter enzymogenes]
MRSTSKTGLALAGLLLSANALACDTILPANQIGISAPGKYCLSGNRSLPIEINGTEIELDCRTRTLVNPSTGGGPGGGVGIMVRGGGKVVVRNCRVDGFANGIQADVGSGAQLLNNTVLRAQDTPIIIHGNPFGPPDPQAEPARIVGNRVIGYGGDQANWGPALRVHGLPRAVIANNVVAGYRGHGGLELGESPDAQLTGNQFLDFEAGHRMIQFINSPRARVVHNTIMSRQPIGEGLTGAVDATCVENVFINVQPSGFAGCSVARYNVEQPQPPTGP